MKDFNEKCKIKLVKNVKKLVRNIVKDGQND